MEVLFETNRKINVEDLIRHINEAEEYLDKKKPYLKGQEIRPRFARVYDDKFWISCETRYEYSSFGFEVRDDHPVFIQEDGDFKS